MRHKLNDRNEKNIPKGQTTVFFQKRVSAQNVKLLNSIVPSLFIQLLFSEKKC